MDKWIPVIILVAIIFVIFAFLSGRSGSGFDITLGMNKNKIAEKEEEKTNALKQSVENDVDNYSKSSKTALGDKSAASVAEQTKSGGFIW